MKKTYTVLIVFLFGLIGLSAQETMRDKMLEDRKKFTDRTMFQQFERSMVPTAEERKAKQDKIRARRELLLTIIDTSQIKQEFKLKLQRDVVDNPFSPRLKKFLEKYDLREKILTQ